MKTGILATTLLLIAGTIAWAEEDGIDRSRNLELSPMAKPSDFMPALHYLDRGKPTDYEIEKTGKDRYTWKIVRGKNKGCSFVSDGWFSPHFSWENCNGTKGSNSIEALGDIWPLEEGKTVSYRGEIHYRGKRFRMARDCAVLGTALVTVGEKEIPTFEVGCTDSNKTRRTWFVSPELGHFVRYQRKRSGRGIESDLEVVLP